MKPKHIHKFVVGSLPREQTYQVSQNGRSISQETQKALRLLSCHVRPVTEMETMVRVLFLVLEVIDRVKDVNLELELELQLQPSIADHPVFTDFYMILKENSSTVPLLIIEVKNSDTSTNLDMNRSSTAQVLREVHILLNHLRLPKLPFILTNSLTWGIGEAERLPSGQIRVTSNTLHHLLHPISHEDSNVLRLLDHLEELVRNGIH